MIVYLARAIQPFVMYCVNGTSRSSLLIESTDYDKPDHVERTAPRFTGLYVIGRGFVRMGMVSYVIERGIVICFLFCFLTLEKK